MQNKIPSCGKSAFSWIQNKNLYNSKWLTNFLLVKNERNVLKIKEAKVTQIIHQYKIRKTSKQMKNNYTTNLTLKILLMLWILEIKHQEFNQQKVVLEARLNAWLQQKKIKLAPVEREKKNLAQYLNLFFHVYGELFLLPSSKFLHLQLATQVQKSLCNVPN